MNKENGMSGSMQANLGLRPYARPQVVRYGEIAQLTAAGSANASESAGSPDMGCLPQFSFNKNCPPGGV